MKLSNKILSLIILFACLAACGCGKVEPKDPVNEVSALRAKRERYLSFNSAWQGSAGCDSLLFSSLGGNAGLAIDILKFEKSPGKWTRNAFLECYPGESSSSISKDMLLGAMLRLVKTGERNALQRMWDFGDNNGWLMGDGIDYVTRVSRTLIAGDLQYLLGASLGKKEYPRRIMATPGTLGGFEGHLAVLKIQLAASIWGSVFDVDARSLRGYCKSQPKNALFCALAAKYDDGDYSQAIETLSDARLFPEDRLPTSADRCEPYLWQRDDGTDWLPCNDQKVHDGIDFLFAASLILD